MTRTTTREVEAVFGRFCTVMNRTKPYPEIGCWYLDHASEYGGWQIYEIINENGGVTVPFRYCGRMNSRAFVTAMEFGITAVTWDKSL